MGKKESEHKDNVKEREWNIGRRGKKREKYRKIWEKWVRDREEKQWSKWYLMQTFCSQTG